MKKLLCLFLLPALFFAACAAPLQIDAAETPSPMPLPSDSAETPAPSAAGSPLPEPTSSYEAERQAYREQLIQTLETLPPLEEIAALHAGLGFQEYGNFAPFVFLAQQEDEFAYHSIDSRNGALGRAYPWFAPDDPSLPDIAEAEVRTHYDQKNFTIWIYHRDEETRKNIHATSPDTPFAHDLLTAVIRFCDPDMDREAAAAKAAHMLGSLAGSPSLQPKTETMETVPYTITVGGNEQYIKYIGLKCRYNWLPNDFDPANYIPMADGAQNEEHPRKFCIKGVVGQALTNLEDSSQPWVRYKVMDAQGAAHTVKWKYQTFYGTDGITGPALSFLCRPGHEYTFYGELDSEGVLQVDAIDYTGRTSG